MPVRAFLDSDYSVLGIRRYQWSVSMPVRAFLDSDRLSAWDDPYRNPIQVSMPVRAFLDSDQPISRHAGSGTMGRFNARQGIS